MAWKIRSSSPGRGKIFFFKISRQTLGFKQPRIQIYLSFFPWGYNRRGVKLSTRLLSHHIEICCRENRMLILKRPNGDPFESFIWTSRVTIQSHHHFGKESHLFRAPENNTLLGKQHLRENAKRYRLKREPWMLSFHSHIRGSYRKSWVTFFRMQTRNSRRRRVRW